MAQIELACEDIVFHFNKKHLEDPAVPMWILKTRGETYYVNHVDCRKGWNTKETPDNPHTKGSIKIKHSLLIIDDDNCATITDLTEHDRIRLRNQEKGITRVVVSERHISKFREVLKNQNVKHGPLKSIGGACTTTFYITDILKKEQFTMLALTMSGTDFRILMPNEGYYKYYDDPKYKDREFIDEDEIYYDDNEDEEAPGTDEGTSGAACETLPVSQGWRSLFGRILSRIKN